MSSSPNSTSFRDDATPAGGRHAARLAVPARKSVKASAKVSRTPVEAVAPEEAFVPDAVSVTDVEPREAAEGTWTLVPGTGTPSSYSAAATMGARKITDRMDLLCSPDSIVSFLSLEMGSRNLSRIISAICAASFFSAMIPYSITGT